MSNIPSSRLLSGNRLSRDDIRIGLRDLISELRRARQPATVRIVGGAAIALVYNASRRATADIDAVLTPRDAIIEAAKRIATAYGWDADWFNDAAGQFLPSGFGQRDAEWDVIYDSEDIVVCVATAETLLAMKLHAAQRRGAREVEDLAALFAASGLDTADAAEELYGQFYPGDEFTDRTVSFIRAALERARNAPAPPTSIDLES